MLSLRFLLDLHSKNQQLTAEEVNRIAEEVNITLRENRRVGELTEGEVLWGNKLLMSLYVFSRIDENLEVDVTPQDIDYIIEETSYLQMGHQRN
jgi:ribosomal protein S13